MVTMGTRTGYAFRRAAIGDNAHSNDVISIDDCTPSELVATNGDRKCGECNDDVIGVGVFASG